MGSGLIVNIVLNYIFVAVLDLGVVGIALGTNIGMLVYTLQFMIYAAKGKAVLNQIIYHSKVFPRIKRNFRAWLSVFTNDNNVCNSNVRNHVFKSYGNANDVSFYGAAFRLFNLFLTPIYGLMRALQPAIGINFGSGNYNRVSKSFKVFALAATLIMLPFWL